MTKKEIIACAKRGWPTILVKGSGRAADEFAGKLEAGDEEFLAQFPADHKLVVVDKNDPATLHAALIDHGFILA